MKHGTVHFPPPRRQLVEIEWLDAAEHAFDGEPKDSPGMIRLCSAGYFIKKTSREITICTDRYPGETTVRTTHVIPRIHILRFSIASLPRDGAISDA